MPGSNEMSLLQLAIYAVGGGIAGGIIVFLVVVVKTAIVALLFELQDWLEWKKWN